MFNQLEFAVSMYIMSILAFTLGWVDGNKAGKEQVKDFMPGDHVCFYDKEWDHIDEGEVFEISITKDWFRIWVSYNVCEGLSETYPVECKCHLFRTAQEAENYYKNTQNETNRI